MAATNDDEEKNFRQRYADVLSKMSERELDDERQRVKQQAMKTPGRRGEQIKHEEIDKEIVRRHSANKRLTS
jgi:hypothetical protein